MKGQNISTMSYIKLKEFLNSHRKRPLSNKQINKVKKYIQKEKIANAELLEKLSNSKLVKLGAIQLKREGKVDGIFIGSKYYYDVNMLLAIEKAYQILRNADDKRIKIRI